MNELITKTAIEMRALISTGEISITELLTAHLEHIEQVNPQVNAIVTECFDHAMSQAKRMDEAKHIDTPLAGIPIAHKDLVSTKNLRTTFGSPLYRDNIPNHSDYIVERMQHAGAITIGKTNVPEFGAGSHTFNRVFGPTCNPYDLERTCGGSSGGAAVSLATRMTSLADGSDLGGSLRNPAAFCNVIGFRPTNNVLPPTLGRDQSMNLASLGPMARNIDDTALLFDVLTDAFEPDRATNLMPIPLKGLRVAFTEDFGSLPVAPEIRHVVQSVATQLADEGANVSEATPNLEGSREIFHTLRGFSFRNRYDEFTSKQKVELKPTILWNMALGIALTDDDLNRTASLRHEVRNRVDKFFAEYDLLVGPTTQVLPFPIPVEWVREIEGVQMNTYIDWMESCSLITTTECPSLSMPAGFADRLPVGVQLIGPRDSDKQLLGQAKTIETIISSAAKLPDVICGS